MGTLKELLPNIKSEVYIVDIEGIGIADDNPIKLKVILSDDILNASVKYITSYSGSRIKVALDIHLKKMTKEQ